MFKEDFEFCPQYQYLEQEIRYWAENDDAPEPTDAFDTFKRATSNPLMRPWDMGSSAEFFQYLKRRLLAFFDFAEDGEAIGTNAGNFAAILLRAWVWRATLGRNTYGKENNNE